MSEEDSPYVVLVPVHMEDLLAGDGQHTREDALGEAGAQHDANVLLVHLDGVNMRGYSSPFKPFASSLVIGYITPQIVYKVTACKVNPDIR